MEEDSNVNKLTDERRKYLEEHRTEIVNKLNGQEVVLDKYLLAITSVLFNAICFFIDNVIELESAVSISYFYLAIFFSGLSIITIIVSIVRSNYIFSELSKILNEGLEKNEETFEKEQKFLEKRKFPISWFKLDKIITFNHASACFVCISIICISIFLVKNIVQLRINNLIEEEQKMSQKSNSSLSDIKSLVGNVSNAPKPMPTNSNNQSQNQKPSQPSNSQSSQK